MIAWKNKINAFADLIFWYSIW